MTLENETRKASTTMPTARLEMFSDGVFAIAITLLILEIKIPKHEDLIGSGGLFNYLVHLWPSYLSYILSFILVGIYWANHHWLFSFVEKTDHYFNLLNILFLMTVAFMPFSSAILGDFVSDPENRNAAVFAYSFGLLIPVPPVLAVYLYATYNHRLVNPKLSKKFISSGTYKLIGSLCFSSLAVGFSFSYPWVSLSIIVLILLVFLMPPAQPEFEN